MGGIMSEDLWAKIGETAGLVYKTLENTGEEITLSKLKNHLKKEYSCNTTIVDMAIGWLAREDKINICKDGRMWKISLKH